MPGALCISIDVELAWGIWDKPSAAYHDRCARYEAMIVRRLVELFETYEVGATWAIVGRLLERDDGAAATTAHGDRIWYAPAVIEAIQRARVPQDIGSHSYGHVYFGEAPLDALRRDLAAARRVHDAHGLPFTSFVFPRNQVAHLDLLREAGVGVFRSTDRGWHMAVRDRLGSRAGRVANLADKLLPIPPSAVHPVEHRADVDPQAAQDAGQRGAQDAGQRGAQDAGQRGAQGPGQGNQRVEPPVLVELPSSMLLMARNGLRRAIHPASIIAKARLGLQAAHRAGGTFHLWFHPSNFYYEPERQLATLASIVAAAAAMRDRGELEIRAMSSYRKA
jgi:peptidoglycan/xylan/chitin deacetylase (PgdA/CDA1 family)